MTHTNRGAIACVVVLAGLAAAPCRGDLFAVMSTGRDVMRIDSATGVVTRTYTLPDYFPPPNAPAFGLAFDGRMLYLTRGAGPLSQIWFLDVTTNVWFPPAFADTFTPSGEQPLSGLGFRHDEFGGSLIGVSRSFAGGPPSPSHVFQYMPQPFFDPFLINTNIPPGELPANLSAHGADIDPDTGDLWIVADQLMGQTIVGRRLIRSDLNGTVLQTLTLPNISPPVMLRGLGFDAGAMFVGGRQFMTNTNFVYEIDRSTGEIIRSFAIPGAGSLNGLAGGDVIPEPSSALLAVIALSSLATKYRRRRPCEIG